jgi:hypothetical protein
MTGSRDITRWNRAGLRRIRYLDANAARYLEELRVRLAERFAGWQALQRGGGEAESPVERNARLIEQYLAPRAAVPDWGWELARAFARACHVLGEHVDAFANESYLGTATQWESLRRLVALVDYQPAPPASAFTHLALIAKPGASGTVPAGFAVAAATPGVRVAFETLEPLAIDSGMNLLRPEDFDRSPEEVTGETLELDGQVDGLAIGEPLIVVNEASGASSAHRIEGVAVGDTTTTVRIAPALPDHAFVRGTTSVHAAPKDRLAALGPTKSSSVIGAGVSLVRGAGGILRGDIIAISDHVHRSFHKVTGVFDPHVALDRAVGQLRFDTAAIAPTVAVAVIEARPGPAGAFTVVVAGNWERLAQQVVADPRALTAALPLRYTVSSAVYTPVTATSTPDSGRTVLRLEANLDGAIPAGTAAPTSLLTAATTTLGTIDRPFLVDARDPIATALPRATTTSDFVVAMMGDAMAWGKIASIVRDEPGARASLVPAASWQRTPGYLLLAATTVFGHFTRRHRLAGWRTNPAPIRGGEIRLDLPVAGGQPVIPGALTAGRKLVIYRLDAPERALLTAVAGATGNTLQLADEIPAAAGFTKGNLHIAGNVVLASHGTRQPEKVLGSGDATQSGQSFALAQPGIAFVADPTQPRGVRAAIDVLVDGRIWQQVGSLRGHGAAEQLYTVRMTENGTPMLEFGDGRNGRRLPTGRNNVRVRARTGVGLAGNLAAGNLTKIARPHPLVAAAMQPLPAVGGNDMEGTDSLRDSAPATLVTMQRCVSPADFAALAAAHASIWQARAFVRPSAGTRAHQIEVIVVPADGGELGGLADSLAAYLQAHAIPNLEVSVTRFRPLPITLTVAVEIDSSAFDPTAVLGDVRAALYDALSLRRRRLGQAVFLGDVYAVVENVPGVSTSRCVLDGKPTQNRILSVSDGVLFLDPASPATLGVSHEVHP